jgi:valyl-tRNA synthetase
MNNYNKIWSNYLNNTKKNKSYTIVCPPPNVTGNLHLGHCLNFTSIDVISRYLILNNYKVNIIGGTDHAANATTIMVRKHYKDITEENFQQKALEWIENSQKNIINQIKDLGVLINWDKFCYTMDPICSQGVIEAFNIIYNKGLIKKSKKMVNWDTHFGTAISDLEVNMIPKTSMIYEINYEFTDGSGFLTVATTRPETIFADCAIAINPQDQDKIHWINKQVFIPIIKKPITIIFSEKVNKDFGTGCLKITPGHSIDDYNIWINNNQINTIEPIDLMDNYGKFVHEILPLEYKGLSVIEARKLIIEQLNLCGNKINSNIPYSDRSETVVEWKLIEQWFFHVEQFQDKAIQLIDNNINFWPKILVNNYKSWINNLQPWCISRNLPLGHKIPIWYDNYGNEFVGHNIQEALKKAELFWGANNLLSSNLYQDHHCLDTWFSSGLFHKSSLNWPHEQNICDLIVTAYDILFFWITRMILMSIALDDFEPFRNVVFHGLIRDKYGNKMSKTKGNTIDPYEIANKFGWDNIRLTLILNSVNNNDLKVSQDSFIQTQKIITKIENSYKYCQLHFKNLILIQPTTNNSILQDMINITKTFIKEYQQFMNQFQLYNGVKLVIYKFFYEHFCDYFIEIHKIIVKEDTQANDVLSWIFFQLLLLIHAYCPFLTEKIFQEYGYSNLLNYNYHEEISLNYKNNNKFYSTMNIISIIRYFQKIFGSKDMIINNDKLESNYLNIVKSITKSFGNNYDSSIVYLDKWGYQWQLTNINKNSNVLQQELNKIYKEIENLENILNNKNFLNKCDENIIHQYQNNLNSYQLLKNCLENL